MNPTPVILFPWERRYTQGCQHSGKTPQVEKLRGNAAFESEEGLWHFWKRHLTTTLPCVVTPKGPWWPPSHPCPAHAAAVSVVLL